MELEKIRSTLRDMQPFEYASENLKEKEENKIMEVNIRVKSCGTMWLLLPQLLPTQSMRYHCYAQMLNHCFLLRHGRTSTSCTTK